MKNELLSIETARIYNALLTVKDWEQIAKKTKYSVSTVSNIFARRVALNPRSQVIATEANKVCSKKIKAMKILTKEAEAFLKNQL